jgi:hypothetical protein
VEISETVLYFKIKLTGVKHWNSIFIFIFVLPTLHECNAHRFGDNLITSGVSILVARIYNYFC